MAVGSQAGWLVVLMTCRRVGSGVEVKKHASRLRLVALRCIVLCIAVFSRACPRLPVPARPSPPRSLPVPRSRSRSHAGSLSRSLEWSGVQCSHLLAPLNAHMYNASSNHVLYGCRKQHGCVNTCVRRACGRPGTLACTYVRAFLYLKLIRLNEASLQDTC